MTDEDYYVSYSKVPLYDSVIAKEPQAQTNIKCSRNSSIRLEVCHAIVFIYKKTIGRETVSEV